MSDVKLILTGDGSELKRELKDVEGAVQRFGKATTLTVEDTRKAWARAGGDFEKFKQELASTAAAATRARPAATPPVTVKVDTSELEKLRGAIDGDIQGLRELSRTVDLTSGVAVTEFRAMVQAQRELMFQTGATAEQFEKLEQVSTRFERSARRFDTVPPKLDQVARQARTAGVAVGHLAFAATAGSGSVTMLASTLATVAAESLHLQRRFPALAANAFAVAGAIGALVGVGAALLDAWKKLKAELPEGEVNDLQRRHIGNLRSAAQVNQEIAAVDRALVDAQAKLGRGDDGSDLARAHQNLLAKRAALSERLREIAQEDRDREEASITAVAGLQESAAGRYAARLRAIEVERVRAIREREVTEAAANQRAAQQRRELANEGADLERALAAQIGRLHAEATLSPYAARLNAIDVAAQEEIRRLRETAAVTKEVEAELIALVHKRAQAEKAAVTAEREKVAAMQRDAVLAQSTDVVAAHEARVRMIARERDEYLKATGDKATAEELFRQRMRELNAETVQSWRGVMDQLLSVTEGSSNARTKAVHNFVKNVRAVEFGYEAAKNVIASLKEGALAVGAAARGDLASAALHGLAAAKHAATAAVAAKEAGGGGGGGAAGGGGGGGGGGGVQRESTRVGSAVGAGNGDGIIRQEIVVVIKDQDNRELARTRARYQRLEDRNQPIRMGV